MLFRYTPTAKVASLTCIVAKPHVDNMGKTNDAHYIGERANRGRQHHQWETWLVQSVQRRDENIQQISEDCIAILKAMLEFDWETYSQMLNAKGYDIKLIKDDKEVVKKRYTKRELVFINPRYWVKVEKLPSKIEATWVGLHASDKNKPAIQSKEVVLKRWRIIIKRCHNQSFLYLPLFHK